MIRGIMMVHQTTARFVLILPEQNFLLESTEFESQWFTEITFGLILLIIFI